MSKKAQKNNGINVENGKKKNIQKKKHGLKTAEKIER